MAHKEVSILALTDMKNQHVNLSNGESKNKNTKTMQLHNLFMSQCMLGAMDELWLVHPECNATWICLISVTIVEIHMLILDVCVSKQYRRSKLVCIVFLKFFIFH